MNRLEREFIPDETLLARDVPGLYANAMRALPESLDGVPPLPIQGEIPTLEELLSDD